MIELSRVFPGLFCFVERGSNPFGVISEYSRHLLLACLRLCDVINLCLRNVSFPHSHPLFDLALQFLLTREEGLPYTASDQYQTLMVEIWNIILSRI